MNPYPVAQVLWLLIRVAGLPYLVLSAAGPLLQAWYGQSTGHPSPYRLFAISNAGSLLGLLSYPLLVEPGLTRPVQGLVWGVGFVFFLVVVVFCAWGPGGMKGGVAQGPPERGGDNIGDGKIPGRALEWVLPMLGTMMLLATTNKITQELAPVPLLWVAPLAVYLGTFILVFHDPGMYQRKPACFGWILSLPAVVFLLWNEERLPVLYQVGGHCGMLFLVCFIFHGELARLQPPLERLTAYYLRISLGGALGGGLIAIVAPMVFSDYVEYHVLLWLGGAVPFWLAWRERRKTTASPGAVWIAVAGSGCALAAAVALQWEWSLDRLKPVHAGRNFFGVLSVHEIYPGSEDHYFRFYHGNTAHGLQFTEGLRSEQSVGYFSDQTGVGIALRFFPRQDHQRVGVVGLGVGTLAYYAKAGDTFRFYEIDPDVVEVAREWFSYLSGAHGTIEVVVGDGRLVLEQEPPQHFDVLILDAFNGDAVPTHLLTREALKIYRRHLAEDGLLVVNISNRHLNLKPVMAGLAQEAGWELRFADRALDPAQWWIYPSQWALMGPPALFRISQYAQAGRAPEADPEAQFPVRPWTDDYTSLLPLMR